MSELEIYKGMVKKMKDEKIIDKEVMDALCMLLNLSLKDKNYTTQQQQFEIVYDYITNLQQRIEYLERSNNRREDTIMGLRDEIVEYEDYKSRCEKVQEIINTEKKLMGYAIYDSCLLLIEEALNGRSDE